MEMTRIGIIGGTGYTGSELARILCTHPDVEIAAMTSRQNAGVRVADVHPFLSGYVDIDFTERISDTKDLDLVFVATPHGVAMNEVPGLLEQGIKAVDLSGDYRMHDVAVYEKWYGHTHTDTENLQRAVYGLPEFFRDEIRGADLVANPGCYATSIILACAPLLKSGLVEEDVIVDAKSGTSGAGMVPSARTHHSTCGESIIPYSVGTHRHTPEIAAHLGTEVIFNPHLGNFKRGIHATLTARLKEGVTAEAVRECYVRAYAGHQAVRLKNAPVKLDDVVHSPYCDIFAAVKGRHIVITGAIDNLMKGASSQAVQAFNLAYSFDEMTALR